MRIIFGNSCRDIKSCGSIFSPIMLADLENFISKHACSARFDKLKNLKANAVAYAT